MDRLNYERTIYGLAMRPINGLVHICCAIQHSLSVLDKLQWTSNKFVQSDLELEAPVLG
jgi:hypothetical protein